MQHAWQHPTVATTPTSNQNRLNGSPTNFRIDLHTPSPSSSTMSNSPTGFAILGAGIFASEGAHKIPPHIQYLTIPSFTAYIPALKALSVRPTLKAIYSRSDESARTLAEVAHKELGLTDPPTLYHDADPNASLDTLLNRSDIDAVIVVLPITLQPAVIIKALKAGKHVLSEKPISPNVALGKQLIETYETVYKPKGLVFRIAENFEAEPVCTPNQPCA